MSSYIDLKYINEICDYLNMSVKDFNIHCSKFRSPHIWKRINKTWKLRHTCNFDGEDD